VIADLGANGRDKVIALGPLEHFQASLGSDIEEVGRPILGFWQLRPFGRLGGARSLQSLPERCVEVTCGLIALTRVFRQDDVEHLLERLWEISIP
jgi:hypothetical protein